MKNHQVTEILGNHPKAAIALIAVSETEIDVDL